MSEEIVPRFLLQILPRGFKRIHHNGLLSSSARRDSLALARRLLAVPLPTEDLEPEEPVDALPTCPRCGGHMTIIKTFVRWYQPRAPPEPTARIRKLAP